MTTETILAAVILAWLATGLGLGYGWSRDHIRANKAEQRAGLLTAGLDLCSGELFRAEEGRKWAELAAETARFRADTAETALRGLLLHQARAELVEPDAASGKVLRFERAGR